MAINDVVKLSLVGSIDDVIETVNTFYYRQSTGLGTVGAAQLPALGDVLNAAVFSLLQPMICTSWVAQYLLVEGVAGAVDGQTGVSFSNASLPGSNTFPQGPVERCCLIQKHTGTANRHGGGRIFTPAPPLNMYNHVGHVDPFDPTGALSAAYAVAAEMINPYTDALGSIWKPCLFDRVHATALDLIGCTVRDLVGIQRRRRIGIGV